VETSFERTICPLLQNAQKLDSYLHNAGKLSAQLGAKFRASCAYITHAGKPICMTALPELAYRCTQQRSVAQHGPLVLWPCTQTRCPRRYRYGSIARLDLLFLSHRSDSLSPTASDFFWRSRCCSAEEIDPQQKSNVEHLRKWCGQKQKRETKKAYMHSTKGHGFVLQIS
jgi:hypothetical protein